MSLNKKLESLIEVEKVCPVQARDYYIKIQDHYNLTPNEMKMEWLQYQLNHYNVKNENLGDA